MEIISEQKYNNLYIQAKEREAIVDGLLESRYHVIVHRLTFPTGEVKHIASKTYDVKQERDYPNLHCFMAMWRYSKRKSDFLELSEQDMQELRLPFFP